MTYLILNYLELLDTTSEKNRYVCPSCKNPNLTINPKSGAYRCQANLCKSDAIRAAINKLAGKTPYEGNGRRRRKLELGTLEARVITRKAAAQGAFDGPEAWMPDLELESEDETEPTPESAVEPKSSQAKEQGGGNLTEDSNANSETVQELADLSKLEDIPCPDILPADLLTPLQNLARRLALPVEGYVTALLPAASAQVSAGTRLELDPSTGFSAPPILWIGLVGDTGTKKSPLLRAIVHPLDSLQAKAEVLYQTRLEDYESEKDAWESSPKNDRGGKPKPPIPREFYLSDYTLEALSSVLGTQSNSGLLVYIDELARFFASMDAYRGGKGGDRQHWLSLYDGGALKVNRKGAGRVYASRTSVSLLGGIQPNIIRKIWQDDPTAEDGLWSRFAWVRLPFSIAPGIQEGPTYDLSGRLKELYQTLAEMPATTYRLSTEAIRVWNKWHHEIENLILQEPSPILRATYPKTRERAARIALVTHLIHAAMAGVDLEPIISAETLRSAIQFTRWLQGQTRLLYAELGVADNPETVKILKFVNRFRGCGWVTTRQIRNWSPGNAKFTFEQCRQFARRVVDLGYAIKNDKSGTDYQVKILPKSGHSVTNSPNAPNSSSFGSDHTQVTPRSFRSQTVEDDPESVTTVTTSDLSMVTSKNDSQNSFEPVSDQVTRNIGKERFDWIPQPGELVRYSGSSQLLKCVRGKTLTVKGVAQQNGYISVAVPSGLDQTIPLKDLKPVKQGVQND